MQNEAKHTGPPQRILLADDDEDDIFLFKEVLAEIDLPCELTVARNGIEALKLINKAPVPDLVILDINMPLKDGIECLEEINSLPNSSEIPVVFLSTSQNADAIARVRQLGANGYLTKPNSFSSYRSMVADVLSKDWKIRQKSDFYFFYEKSRFH